VDREREYRRRIEIVLEFLERIRAKYRIDFWGIAGSTARKDFSPQADIDLAISVDIPIKEKQHFIKWVKPIIDEFNQRYGILIDLSL
jgi:predicted nucleotidyltransferase